MIARKKATLKKKDIDSLALILTLPYLVVTLLYLKINSFRYICVFLMFLFLSIFLIRKKTRNIRIKYLFLFIFLVIMFFILLLNESVDSAFKRIIFIILNFAPIYIFDYFFYNNDSKISNFYYSKKIVYVTIPILIYCMYITLYYVNSNPYIARNLANWDSTIEGDKYLPTAMGGGYALVYGLLFIPPILVYLIRENKKNYIKSIMYILVSIFIVYFIFRCGFTTAFLISIIGVFLALIPRTKGLGIKYSISILILILLIIISNDLLMNEIINKLLEFIPQESIIYTRINEIIPALYSNNRESSFGLRLNGIQMTIDTIIKNPIFGIVWDVGFDYNMQKTYLGLHTEWIDTIGKYGIGMSIPYYIFLIISCRDLVEKYSNHAQIIKIILFLLFILGLCNPIMNSNTLLFIFVLIPSMININIKTD